MGLLSQRKKSRRLTVFVMVSCSVVPLGDKGVYFFLSLSVVYNQLLCFFCNWDGDCCPGAKISWHWPPLCWLSHPHQWSGQSRKKFDSEYRGNTDIVQEYLSSVRCVDLMISRGFSLKLSHSNLFIIHLLFRKCIFNKWWIICLPVNKYHIFDFQLFCCALTKRLSRLHLQFIGNNWLKKYNLNIILNFPIP